MGTKLKPAGRPAPAPVPRYEIGDRAAVRFQGQPQEIITVCQLWQDGDYQYGVSDQQGRFFATAGLWPIEEEPTNETE